MGIYSAAMSFWFKTTRYLLPVMAFGAASYMAIRFDGTALWHGLDTVSSASAAGREYDLTQLRVASDVVKLIRDKYVDPKRVKPREMLLSALNFIQRDVAQVIVVHEEGAPTLKVRSAARPLSRRSSVARRCGKKNNCRWRGSTA